MNTTSSIPVGYCLKPTIKQRILEKLFHHNACNVPNPDFPKADIIVSRTITKLSGWDRIRILFTGKCLIESYTATENIPGRVKTNAAFTVLAPSFLDDTYRLRHELKFVSVFRYSENESKFRLFRWTWATGPNSTESGWYSSALKISIWKKAFHFATESGGWAITLLGLRIHRQRSYGGWHV